MFTDTGKPDQQDRLMKSHALPTPVPEPRETSGCEAEASKLWFIHHLNRFSYIKEKDKDALTQTLISSPVRKREGPGWLEVEEVEARGSRGPWWS